MSAVITSIRGLQNMVNLVSFNADYNALTSVNLSNLPNLSNVDISNNNLTQTTVNNILVALSQASVVSGNVDLSGATNAVPNGAGLAALSVLQGRGWTTFINSYVFSLTNAANSVDACNSSSFSTYYCSSSQLGVSKFLYQDSSLTTPATIGWYADGVNSYQVTSGSGEITATELCLF